MELDDSQPAERPPLERVLLVLAYDGAAFSGFAQQTNAPSIASTVDAAIREIDPGASRLVGASRTDGGVHARLQPAAFGSTKRIPSRSWVLALTSRLPPAICVTRAARVETAFDPRKHALWKRYKYRVLRSQIEDPFLAGRAWRVGQPIDVEAMRLEARTLLGTHDFAAFRSVEDRRVETVRSLSRVDVDVAADDARCVDVTVEGNKFMHNMVRIIVGTLVDVGLGRTAPGACQRALTSLRRSDLGMTAPARGLCLEHVELDTWGEDAWPDRAGGAPI
ncbi:MAG TPA: tRNA pseudouridine(38-40) synthase TruA [Polyangiaceae bacterium]|nr:tRNA pseudouridine(38-40) synthase TruA [Polyangiaceae bacterium]